MHAQSGKHSILDNHNEVKEESVFNVQSFDFKWIECESMYSLLSFSDSAYTFELIHYKNSRFSIGLNFRTEDETLPYEAYKYLLKESFYVDFKLNYHIGNFAFQFTLENLANYRDTGFEIEPILEDNNIMSNAFYMSHEANALVSVSLVYNF